MERPVERRHAPDMTPPAPGDLELVRSFVSLHEHEAGSLDSQPPSLGFVERWLRSNRLIDDDEPAVQDDLAWTAGVLEDLRVRVFQNGGRPADPAAVERLNAAAREAGLEVQFGNGGRSRFEARAKGVRGAIGRLLAIAFLAELDGTWVNFKECESPTCRAVFYDRSKNRSGKWCSMQSCGNRAKVRAFRERRAAGT